MDNQEEQTLKLMRLLMHLQGRLASCHGQFTSLRSSNLLSTQGKGRGVNCAKENATHIFQTAGPSSFRP
jgi:hypothetical protein